MDFKNYKQGPPEYPFLAEVATEHLVRPNGKPTLLAHLLKDLGCTVHVSSNEHGTTPVTNDEAILAPVVERIIKDYIQYDSHHADGHDRTSIGDAMRDDVSYFMDPGDFVPESGELRAVSIDDIEEFMADIVRIRTDKGEKLKNGNPQLQARINTLCAKLADTITKMHLAAAGENCQNIANVIRQEVHGVTGFAQFSAQMSLLKRSIYKKIWSKIDTKKPIQNEKILHLFAVLRALTRLRNQEAGINTGNELNMLKKRRRQEDEKKRKGKFIRWEDGTQEQDKAA